jgi:hypothetical protein
MTTAITYRKPAPVITHGAAVRTGDTWRRTFASVADYIAHQTIIARPGLPGDAEARRADCIKPDAKPRRKDWYGVESRDDVLAAVTGGWPDGIARLSALSEKLGDVPTPRDARRRPVRGPFGDEYDPHAGMRGAFDTAWTRRARLNTVGVRRVRIVAQILDNFGTSADELFWRGAAALMLAQTLMGSGYAVQIDAAFAGSYSWERGSRTVKRFLEIITVKPMHSPLDLPNLAGVVCLAGFARTYGFAGITTSCAEANDGACISSGLGSSCSLDSILEAPRGTFITPRINSERAALDWIKAVLADVQGGE